MPISFTKRFTMPKFVLPLMAMLLLLAIKVNAQSWEIGGTIGGSGYMGDFNQTNPLKFTDGEYALFIKRNFGGYFSAKFSVTHASIRGADSTSSNEQMRDRNLSFFSTLDEISLIGELNFMSYVPQIGQNKFTPFIYLGIGKTNYAPMATYNGTDYDLRSLMTEGQTAPYKETAIAIPYGAGIKYNFAGQWNLILDLGYRTTNTGYLDDVYGNYAPKASLSTDASRALSDRSGEQTGTYIGSPNTQRGNFNHDTYMFLGFSISYTFLSSKCYSFN